jgi:hypothetical protein
LKVIVPLTAAPADAAAKLGRGPPGLAEAAAPEAAGLAEAAAEAVGLAEADAAGLAEADAAGLADADAAGLADADAAGLDAATEAAGFTEAAGGALEGAAPPPPQAASSPTDPRARTRNAPNAEMVMDVLLVLSCVPTTIKSLAGYKLS